MFGQASPRDGGEIPLDPTVDSGASPRDAPVGIWSGVKGLLEEWAPPPGLGKGGDTGGSRVGPP